MPREIPNPTPLIPIMYMIYPNGINTHCIKGLVTDAPVPTKWYITQHRYGGKSYNIQTKCFATERIETHSLFDSPEEAFSYYKDNFDLTTGEFK